MHQKGGERGLYCQALGKLETAPLPSKGGHPTMGTGQDKADTLLLGKILDSVHKRRTFTPTTAPKAYRMPSSPVQQCVSERGSGPPSSGRVPSPPHRGLTFPLVHWANEKEVCEQMPGSLSAECGEPVRGEGIVLDWGLWTQGARATENHTPGYRDFPQTVPLKSEEEKCSCEHMSLQSQNEGNDGSLTDVSAPASRALGTPI